MTGKQASFLQAMLEESTITKAAAKAGISRNTAYKYLKDEAFQIELNQRRSDCITDAVRYLQGNLSKCSEELVRIIDAPAISEQVKINAINSVFSVYRSLSEIAEIQVRLDQVVDKLTLLEESGLR